jgi:hypothetical protein
MRRVTENFTMADFDRERPRPIETDPDLITGEGLKTSPEQNAQRAEHTLRNTATAFFIFAGLFVALLILILIFIVAVMY